MDQGFVDFERFGVIPRAIGLVHPCRRLQRDPLLGCVRRGMAIRMHLALQRVVGAVEHGGIEAETLGQAEQLEMVTREIDHEKGARLVFPGCRENRAWPLFCF
jgi:hypothetical protein